MRIGLISDTRVSRAQEVPIQVARALGGVELILHAGGIFVPEVLDWLERIAPVKAVGRTMGDRSERPQFFETECTGDPRVAKQQVFQIEGHTIGLAHELYLPRMSDDILPGVLKARRRPDESLAMMIEEFFGTAVDIVVFGRTLYAMVEEHQGMLFINPGSPSLPRNLRKLGSVAILDLTPVRRDARLIDLSAFS
ncbi:MAG: YfcE family phosphodiesterase [Dehalococcoidia bacterium]|nr:YfcE family phosphodiesterase [Dehalococcoidia bacterium]